MPAGRGAAAVSCRTRAPAGGRGWGGGGARAWGGGGLALARGRVGREREGGSRVGGERSGGGGRFLDLAVAAASGERFDCHG